jgi:ATP-binding cassette subfamily C (CFTR/MRP) protein 1
MIEKRGGLLGELKIDAMSHGEQQLLALARAILRKRVASGRCILVLDEATGNLDKEPRPLCRRLLKSNLR